jgi:folylpolyglutamate synthase/dihydropteroate synthase
MTKLAIALLASLAVCSFSGCRKPPAEDPNVIKAAESQPGAAEVMAAVNKKDFDGVLAALNKVQEKVTTDEQNVQFLLLARQAREKISEIAPNDPKAMEVVAALRSMVTGR